MNNMKIIQIQSNDRQNQKAFINFPFRLYKNTPQWVPPIRMEIIKIFKPDYAFYNYGEAAFFLAKDDQGEVLGRLATANNHRYNTFYHSNTAFFYYFECVDKPAVAEGLFSKGFEWVKSQGLNHVLGPKGFMVLDGFGMLVEGFEHQPAFSQPYNLPYYPDLVEAQGFTKVKDILTGWIDRSTKWPEKILKAAQILERRKGIHAPEISKKRALLSIKDDLQKLYNESLAGPAGNPPITDEDMDAMVSQLYWIADPKLIKLIYQEDQPIGWMLAYPDVGAALQRSKGRLFPLGWLQIMLESKRSRWINLNGAGVIEEYQRLGVTAVLINELYKSVMESDRYQYAELLQFREENINSLLEASNVVDIHFHKRHRLYEKFL